MLMGSLFPKQLPPSQLLIKTLYQLANGPGTEGAKIPPMGRKLDSQFLLDPKSLLANLRQSLREELRSCLKHHPLGVHSNIMRILLAALEMSSGSQMQRAAGDPSRHIAPFFVGRQLREKKLKLEATASRPTSRVRIFIYYRIYSESKSEERTHIAQLHSNLGNISNVFAVWLLFNLFMSHHKELFVKNPWHGVSYGENAPQFVNAIIQIPAESKVKYELDKDSGLLKLDRVLFSAVHYPQNYGFIPRTYCDDHDPLDILVICSVKVEPMCLVEAKVIGVMHMLDQDEGDDKIIAVAAKDKSVSHFNDISELPQHLLEQIHRFFEDYKKLEKKKVEVLTFQNHEHAFEVVRQSIKLYEKEFGDKKEEP